MRKTTLLLDAVRSAGRTGAVFAALDLCQASLAGALQQLAGACGAPVLC
jgi:hypothetical protein